MPEPAKQASLRRLPSIEVLAARAPGLAHRLAVSAAQFVIRDVRRRLLEGEHVDVSLAALDELLLVRAHALSSLSLRPVINATGVILHTNLGRAPLAPLAAEAAAMAASSYTNLEYDLCTGKRGSRQDHIEKLLCEFLGTQSALAVNNNAAGVLLALAALAGEREVIISRGQLIEIGGSFRIPEILASSGAKLREVGTANRTYIADYEEAIGEQTAALLRVHRSNFEVRGFTKDVPLQELCELADRHGLPVIDDLGSGAVLPFGDEPTLQTSIAAGATIVCSSADKLLGGPQAGLLLGSRSAIKRCRSHPLARALRIDKMQLAALEATLRMHWLGENEGVPTLAMMSIPAVELEARAQLLSDAIGESATVTCSASRPGGGSLPGTELPGAACAVDSMPLSANAFVAALRQGEPSIVARITDGRVLLDPRTIEVCDLELVGRLVRANLSRS
ncbi:MAG: L-seryl-tRNA(Sec) selenium transferase [Solirubrobacterales bacterium]